MATGGGDYYQAMKIFDPAGHPGVVLDRAAFLAAFARNKAVLHVGCADWPGTGQRLEAGTLLHLQLAACAASLVGIDSSVEGIEALKKAGLDNCLVMDAEQLSLSARFDVIVAGDVMEHLSNPGLFVARAADLLSPDGQLVIGVPNAFSAADFARLALRHRESTHYEHTAVCTPKTLGGLCSRFGFAPTQLTFTLQPPGRGESSAFVALRNIGVRLFRTLAPSFVMVFQRPDVIDQRVFYVWR